MGGDRDALHRMQRHAREAGCEFMIHGGDFCHGPSQTLMGEKIADFVGEYNHSPVPAYHALGNHDTDNTPWEEVLRYYNMPDGHLNNEPPVRPDLTDGQTYEEIQELAPDTLPEEKTSLMEKLKADRPEHEARQVAPPAPERER